MPNILKLFLNNNIGAFYMDFINPFFKVCLIDRCKEQEIFKGVSIVRGKFWAKKLNIWQTIHWKKLKNNSIRTGYYIYLYITYQLKGFVVDWLEVETMDRYGWDSKLVWWCCRKYWNLLVTKPQVKKKITNMQYGRFITMLKLVYFMISFF